MCADSCASTMSGTEVSLSWPSSKMLPSDWSTPLRPCLAAVQVHRVVGRRVVGAGDGDRIVAVAGLRRADRRDPHLVLAGQPRGHGGDQPGLERIEPAGRERAVGDELHVLVDHHAAAPQRDHGLVLIARVRGVRDPGGPEQTPEHVLDRGHRAPALSSPRIHAIIGVSASTGASSGVGEVRMMPTSRSSELPSSMTSAIWSRAEVSSVTAVTMVSLSRRR